MSCAPYFVYGVPFKDRILTKQFHSIQIGRALAAQYVAIFYAEKIIKAWMGQSLNSGFALAGHSGVEFFFVLSGFIMPHVHWKDIDRPDSIYPYVRSRVIRIYPIF